ncbi:hypothetical protein AURDEDRAFT_155146 [Auricularia subglabra TFB-10046 SS5]|uniref:Uncharacterized protein n=1 Tax=Auricularia subglabra (strain TFB-10046 / SS5) TaxID=717982 RepID=J0CQ80_AURST|nr:hypothetical protein AURDEDRAFT_155146 [Auricularia subglabra TFB-10046 SS5]
MPGARARGVCTGKRQRARSCTAKSAVPLSPSPSCDVDAAAAAGALRRHPRPLLRPAPPLQPLNATLIPASSEKEQQQQAPSSGTAPVPDAPPASSPALAHIFGESRFPRSLAALRRRQDQQHQQPDAGAEDDDDDDAPRLAEPQLQLSVLLAMPARQGEPAELALGVARERVPEGWRPPEPATPQEKI